MRLVNLTGRTVFLRGEKGENVCVPPLTPDETYGNPVRGDEYDSLIADGVQVIGETDVRTEYNVLIRVHRPSYREYESSTPLPPPEVGTAFIVQSNVADFYTERDDLYVAGSTDLHRPTRYRRT